MGIDELHECVTNISTRADQADLETQETAGSTIWSKEQTGGGSQRVRAATVEGNGQATFWVVALLQDWRRP